MSDAEMVPVTQAARDAAADLFGRSIGGEIGMHSMRAGVADNHRFVQAFARAMLAAEAAAIERCAKVADEYADRNGMTRDLCLRLATAIRSLKEGASHVG